MEASVLEHLNYIITGIVASIGGIILIIKWLTKAKANGNGGGNAREMGSINAKLELYERGQTKLFQLVEELPGKINTDRLNCPHLSLAKRHSEAIGQIQQDVAGIKVMIDERRKPR